MPLVVPFQRVSVYETSSHFYLVGSHYGQHSYHLLKIDRTEAGVFSAIEDKHIYTLKEISDVISTLQGCVKKKPSALFLPTLDRPSGGPVCPIECYGVLGVVRFLFGHYIFLVTKASALTDIGYHAIFKVEETAALYVPSEVCKSSEELKYLKMFQSILFLPNFYFSYTYDLSRTLQSNVLEPSKEWHDRFVWNTYLLEPLMLAHLNPQWFLPIVHGFVGFFPINLPSHRLRLVLIARRSKMFAGPRFMKRGANCDGDSANEVETEQVVFSRSVPSFLAGQYASFVQLRGSVPLIWSQDVSKVVGKLPIQIDLADPFACVVACHFRNLFARYGHPLVVINLVKRRERRKREGILHEEFQAAVSYLNQFIDPVKAVRYLSFDMARCHKGGDSLTKLEEISSKVLQLNGWFQTFRIPYCLWTRRNRVFDKCNINFNDGTVIRQRGVPRTNCVDCLDRTNVAQFVAGKTVLAYQLYCMGIIEEPYLNFDHELCRVLEALYDEHGDALAMQYAGSQLVHSIKTYKKTAHLQERSRDVIQTLSRYYSNNFVDFDKQNALNLFLGIFRPLISKLPTQPRELVGCQREGRAANFDADYCAWFEKQPNDKKPMNGIASAVVESCFPLPDSRSLAVGYYYKVSDLTEFDEIMGRSYRWISTVSHPTDSPTPSILLWWKNRHSKTKENGEEGYDKKKNNEETSSDEETAKSDYEIIYQSDWDSPAMEGTVTPVRRNVSAKSGRRPSPLLVNKVSCLGFELRTPNREDLIAYELYAALEKWTGQQGEMESRGSTLKLTGFHFLPKPLTRFLLCQYDKVNYSLLDDYSNMSQSTSHVTYAELTWMCSDERSAIAFLQEQGVLHRERTCSCLAPMVLSTTGWPNFPVEVQQENVREGFVLSHKNVVTRNENSRSYRCPFHAAIEWNLAMREVVADTFMRNKVTVGGPGLTVQMDETVYSKRKYNRGRSYPQQWVFGGVCLQTDGCFMMPVPNRSSATLISAI
uniref:SAC domain-containing protein n=1 Tax=Trichuris muris TaxID=70415 RepID=A0A5S6QSF4_TRIMR